MTEVITELPDIELGELVLSVLYRLSAYALVNLLTTQPCCRSCSFEFIKGDSHDKNR
jgi:hypothetical protein